MFVLSHRERRVFEATEHKTPSLHQARRFQDCVVIFVLPTLSRKGV